MQMRLNAAAPPRYTVLGVGRWAGIVVDILTKLDRSATSLSGNRQAPGESEADYLARLHERMKTAGDIVWIAVPPGPHVAAMMRAALDQDRHVIVEKPWLGGNDESRALARLAAERGLSCAVHYQYCFLDKIREHARILEAGRDMVFSGQFTISRASLNGILPGLNLGSHLLSLWRGAFPAATRGPIVVGYEQEDCRVVRLTGIDGTIEIDFTRNAEPIVQRFVAAFESGTPGTISLSLAAEIGALAQCL